MYTNEDLSRKGAKTQSAAALLKCFLCAFASLRESILFLQKIISGWGWDSDLGLESGSVPVRSDSGSALVRPDLGPDLELDSDSASGSAMEFDSASDSLPAPEPKPDSLLPFLSPQAPRPVRLASSDYGPRFAK